MKISRYPDIPALSEEKGGIETCEGYLWVIDPVDGTLNFFLQDDHFGVSIALVENGKTVAGVIYLPARNQLFSASRDMVARFRLTGEKEGEWTHPRVNQEDNLASAQFWVEWGKEAHGGDDHKKVQHILAKLDRRTLYPQIRNCTTASMMAVACGKIAGCVLSKPEPFDIAAAALIVEQAGGKVTHMDGSPWGPFSRSLAVSNGALHEDLLRILKMKAS